MAAGKPSRKSSPYVQSLIRGITAPGGRYATADKALYIGERIRASYVQYPILPGAITTFQQIASSREWVVTGEPEKASLAWEYLQNAETIDPMTGMTEYGFEQYQKRRILDYVTVGRTSFASRLEQSNKTPILKYIDPINLIFRRQNLTHSAKNGIRPPRPREKTWMYHGIVYAFEDVVINHPIPQGTRGFVAPVFAVLPMANLVWLLREHDMSSMDGRRIRDIILVSNSSMQDALEDAIHIQAGLWSGESVEDVGLPIVEINNPTGTPVKDMISMLGISQVPDGLEREAVVFEYVNEISANLGLTLRHFWNNEKTTNKALEQVQEQRQQQKGTAAYVRTEQRLINNSQFLNRLDDDPENRVRFSFIEETDASVMEIRADVLKKTTEALEKARTVFGAQIRPEDYLAWMQSEQIMPREMTLQDVEPEIESLASEEDMMPKEGEETLVSDPSGVAIPRETEGAKSYRRTEENLKYGHVMIDSAGRVIATRKKIFSARAIRKVVEQEAAGVTAEDIDAQIDDWMQEGDQIAYTKVSETYIYAPDIIERYLVGVKSTDEREAIEEAVDYVVSNIQLTTVQSEFIDDLYIHIVESEMKSEQL